MIKKKLSLISSLRIEAHKYSRRKPRASVDPSTLMNNQDKNSPNNRKTISSRRVVKIMKNFNKGIFSWSQIPRTTFLRIVWPTIRKTTNETLGVKEFLTNKLKIQRECWVYSWWHSTARGFPFFAHWWFVKLLSRKEMCWEGFFFLLVPI